VKPPLFSLRFLRRDEDPPRIGRVHLLIRLARELRADLTAISEEWGPVARRDLARVVLAYHARLLTGRFGDASGTGRLHRIRLRPGYAGELAAAEADFYFRATASDLHVLREVFVHQAYDYPYQDIVGPVRRVLDLGSNIGASCMYFGLRFPKAALVCVEPVRENVVVLERNAHSNRLPWRIEAIAIAATTGKADLYANRWWASSSTSVTVAQARTALPHRPESLLAGRVAQVAAITVDDLLDRVGWDSVDIVKVDIEGAEREILLEAAPHWLKRTGALVIDIHSKYVPRDRIVARLDDYGLRPAANRGPHAAVFIRSASRSGEAGDER
jgi:FkbM family methyltransferase